MRLALIVAFVSSVFLTTEPASAKPRGDQKTETSKRAKKKVKAKAPTRTAKASRKPTKAVAKVEDEDAPVVREEDASAKEVARPARSAALRRGGSVAQSTDDEVPRNEPKKR